jgi:hypothetical protein
VHVEGPAIGRGTIWRISAADDKESYVYGPAAYKSVEPNINVGCAVGETDTVLETIEWELMGWNEVRVERDRAWWEIAQKKVDAFWDDVEVARRGEFVVPDAKRRRRGSSGAEKCMVQLGEAAAAAAQLIAAHHDAKADAALIDQSIASLN